MKPRLLHKEAMEFSFQAKQALETGDYMAASEYYIKAAQKEGELARFYFDKPELEPTRSTIVRSAAFLHIKAGLIPEAQQLIFWGLLNVQNTEIKEQLELALELSMALKNIDVKTIGYNVEYFRVLRMKSVHYTMEPVTHKFGNLISLEMFNDFATEYLKSLKSFANVTFMRVASSSKSIGNKIEEAAEEFERLINPLITTSGIGSFTFAIANDFLSRGEETEVAKLKADILIDYHERIFTNPLDDIEIELLKNEYKEEEINQIFKPITKIKSANSPYKVAYFDNESYQKKYIPSIAKAQRKKLLPLNPPSPEDIGILESFVVHARKLNDGKKKRSVIQKEQLKTYELEFKTNQIEPKDTRALILNEEIIVDVDFDATKGFSFSYEELSIDHTDTDYTQGLQTFYTKFYNRLIMIIQQHSQDSQSNKEWQTTTRLLNNPESLLK